MRCAESDLSPDGCPVQTLRSSGVFWMFGKFAPVNAGSCRTSLCGQAEVFGDAQKLECAKKKVNPQNEYCAAT